MRNDMRMEAGFNLPILFQAAEAPRAGHVAQVRASHELNTIEKKIWLASQATTRAKPTAKALIFALGLSIVVAALDSVQPAEAQNAGRERNIRECNQAENLSKPDAEEKTPKTGSRMLRYRTCMMERGDVE